MPVRSITSIITNGISDVCSLFFCEAVRSVTGPVQASSETSANKIFPIVCRLTSSLYAI